MQGIAVINGSVLKAVSGKVRQQQILVGDLDPIRIHLSFIDVVSGDRRHQIEHISRIHFINRIILAVPKFDTGVCQYQRSAGSSVTVCRYRKQHRRQAGHDHQDCQQDTDDSCTQVSCLFCLHKKNSSHCGNAARSLFCILSCRLYAAFPQNFCTGKPVSRANLYRGSNIDKNDIHTTFFTAISTNSATFNCSIVSTIKRTFWHKSRKLL